MASSSCIDDDADCRPPRNDVGMASVVAVKQIIMAIANSVEIKKVFIFVV